MSVTQICVCVPVQKVVVLLQRLLDGQQATPENHGTMLCQLLERYGWSASEGRDGAVLLHAYRGRDLDLAHDLVLKSLAGIVSPGSFLVGFLKDEGNEALPWYILYTADEKLVYYEQPTKQLLPALLVCPACGSLAVQDWRSVEYTAIVYPVLSVNSLHIRTAADLKEIQFESVIKAYIECSCGEEVPKDARTIEIVP